MVDDLTMAIRRKKPSIPDIAKSFLALLLSRVLLLWATGGGRYVWNHRNALFSINEGLTGFGPGEGKGHSPVLESLYWQHACFRYRHGVRLKLSGYRSQNRSR